MKRKEREKTPLLVEEKDEKWRSRFKSATLAVKRREIGQDAATLTLLENRFENHYVLRSERRGQFAVF